MYLIFGEVPFAAPNQAEEVHFTGQHSLPDGKWIKARWALHSHSDTVRLELLAGYAEKQNDTWRVLLTPLLHVLVSIVKNFLTCRGKVDKMLSRQFVSFVLMEGPPPSPS